MATTNAADDHQRRHDAEEARAPGERVDRAEGRLVAAVGMVVVPVVVAVIVRRVVGDRLDVPRLVGRVRVGHGGIVHDGPGNHP